MNRVCLCLFVLSVWLQPGDEASLLCEWDHTEPEQQKPEVKHALTAAFRRYHDWTWCNFIAEFRKIHTKDHLENTKHKCVYHSTSQDQSSGAGAAGGRVFGERWPWHHPLGLWQLQRGFYTLLQTFKHGGWITMSTRPIRILQHCSPCPKSSCPPPRAGSLMG